MKIISPHIFITVILLWLGSLTSLFAQKSVLIPESDHKKILVKTGDENATIYYELLESSNTKFTLKGPGKVSIHIKVALENDDDTDDNINTIKYILDGKIIKVTSGGDSSITENSIIIGERYTLFSDRMIHIDIPPGTHELEVASTASKNKVYSKYYFHRYPNPSWKERLPLRKVNTKVELTSVKKRKPIKYYRINDKKNLKFIANDNFQFKLLIRPEFKHNMFSNETRILLKEKGKTIHTFKVSSTRSTKIKYISEDKLIPGTLNQIYLQAPKNKQVYELVVADKGKSALVKIYYDKKKYSKKLYPNQITKNHENKNLDHTHTLYADVILR